MTSRWRPLSLWERAGVRASPDASAAIGAPHPTPPGRPHPSPLPEGEGTRPWLLGALVTLLALMFVAPAAAQAPAREQQFVYGLNVFTGTEYTGNFVPASVDAIYLIADQVGVLDPKRTEVYFWPITNDYRPDWTALNELVPGTLELLQGGRVVRTIELTDYVVQFDRAAGIGNGRISLGPQAIERRAQFERERQTYLDRLHEYTDASEQYQQKLDELRNNPGATTPPPAPNQPAPFSLFSTDLAKGFPLELPAGEYAIQLRTPDGQVPPGSRKRLVAIAQRRQGVGYEVIPQEKWTVPEQASDPSNAIYTVPGGVVYLRPFVALEFNALELARVNNPQDVEATANRWTWLQVAPVGGGPTLQAGGERIAAGEYSVEQAPGAALGYTIVPFERRPDDLPEGTLGHRSPDLIAYRVEAPSGRAQIDLRLVDASGRELAGSARQIRATPGALDWQLAIPILIPLAVGATVTFWRRDRLLTARSLTPELRRLMA
jgi:hypothetical protein